MSATEDYLQYLSSEMEKTWSPDLRPEFPVQKIVLKYQIDKNGGLRSVRLWASCGYTVNDQSALKAVQNAAPFHKPPSGELVNIQTTFLSDYAARTKHIESKFYD